MHFKGTSTLLLKDLDVKQGIVQSYWNAFNNKDDGSDIAVPGCWSKSIGERGPTAKQPRIKFLYQHNETMLLGKPSELVEDAFGLLATTKVVPTTLGQDVLLLYEAGVITEHSVGYEVVQAQWDAKQAARMLIECVLWEGSAVTWGMNSDTPTVSVKALAQPDHLTAIATKAAKLDKLLHDGNLRSDALCETLARELKSLQTALAPTRTAADRPYSIQGVLDSMSDLKSRLLRKSASGKTSWPLGERDAAWDNGAAHKRIVDWATKDDGSVDTGKLKSVHFYSPDGDAAENVSEYKLLFCDVSDGKVEAMPRAIFACAGSHGIDNTTGISDGDKAKIKNKIEAYYKRMADEFDDDSITVPWADDDSSDKATDKGASMNKRLIKGSGGDVEVSADGSHAAYTGTHKHSHKTYKSQGGDDMHDEEHTHDGDANHDHHGGADGKSHSHSHQRQTHKARDFEQIFAQDRNARDLLEDLDDLTDTLEDAMCELLLDNGGHGSEGAEGTTVDTILAQFETRVRAWFVQAQQSDTWDDIADAAQSEAEWMAQPLRYYDYWCSNRRAESRAAKHGFQASATATIKAMPDAPALLRKDGRAISSANREVITKALDGMSDAMKSMKDHHGAIADLMTKTDPDAVRQDEDDTQGDDDTQNGGTDPNKSRRWHSSSSNPAPDRRSKAGTTHQGNGNRDDTTALLADLDSVVNRLKQNTAGKAK